MQTQPNKIGILNNKKKLIPIILLAVVGIILLLIGNGIGKVKNSTETPSDIITIDEYVGEQENKIAELCDRVYGVSNVTVVLSVEGGYEYVYAKNSDERVSDSNYEFEYKYVTIGSGSTQKLVLVSQKPPKINGVAIVCSGGGNIETQKKLISLISAAYNIGTNKIYIAEAKNQ
jgi:stage III sporulation protein AG